MPSPVAVDPSRAALLLVDLQVGVTRGFDSFPHTGAEVVANAARLVSTCRDAAIPIVFVTVNYGPGNLIQVDVPSDWGNAFAPPEGWDELDPGLGAEPGDLRVVKHAMSAFYGTDLDVQLRQRGIRELIVGGIATHGGVESTARSAFDRAYAQYFVSDAMASVTLPHHQHCVEQVFPMMGHVVTTDDVVASVRARRAHGGPRASPSPDRRSTGARA